MGGVGEARRWLWPRECWSAATGSIRSREGKQRSEGEGGPESEGEVRGGRGLRGVAGGTRGGGGSQAGRRWPGRVAARAGRVPVLLAEEEDDKGEEVGWAGQMELGQVSGAR